MLLLSLAISDPIAVEASPSRIIAQALSPDRRTAVLLSGEGEATFWSITPSAQARLAHRIKTLPWPEEGNLPDFAAVSDAGHYLVLRRPHGGFDLWSTRPAKVLRHLEVPLPNVAWYTAWLPKTDGFLIGIDSTKTRLIQVDGRTLDLPIGAPWTFTPDGASVLGTQGHDLALADLATGRVVRRFADATETFAPAAFSPDGTYLVTAGEDPAWRGPDIGPNDPAPTEAAYVHGLKLKIWRVHDGRRLHLLDGYGSNASNPRLLFLDTRRFASPDAGVIVDAASGRVLRRFEPTWTDYGLHLPPLSSAPLKERPIRFPERPSLGRNLAVSPNGRFLVASEPTHPARLLLWTVNERRLLGRLPLPEVLNLRQVTFSSNDRLSVEGDRARPPGQRFDADGFPRGNEPVRVDLALTNGGTLASRKTTPLATPSRTAFLTGMGQSPVRSHDSAFTIGTRHARGYMWVDLIRTNTATGEEAWVSSDIDFPHSPIVISPDDRRFSIAWSKGPVRPDMRTTLSVFDAAIGKPLVSSPLGPTVWSMAYSPDGARLLLSTAEGIQVRDATTLRLLAQVAEHQENGDTQVVWLTNGGFATIRMGKDVRLFGPDARLLGTLIAFPWSGWAAWTPGGKAWGSPDGLAHLRRQDGDRLVPVTSKG